jgi:P4 family phage/plasmid primase-like protien
MTLSPAHRTMLVDGSSIAETIIQARGYCTLDQPDNVRDLGFSKVQARTAPVLAIPLWDVHGQQTGWQIRPDQPRVTAEGKILKYENPKGSRLSLDIHPSVQPLLGDPTVPLWITEGVRKEDALVSREACTIALRGVWGFKGTNEHGGKVILPDWQYVALNGRVVYVVFDSDIYFKPEVEHALRALYRFLRDRQARPGLVRWPEEYWQTKIGVDDYFAQGHGLDEVLAMVPPMGPLSTIAPAQRNGHGLQPQSRAEALLTDTFNAIAFVADHGHKLRYCYPWDAWLVWTGTHWQRDTSGEVMRLAKATVKQLARRIEGLDDEKRIAELLAHIKTSLSTAKLKALIENAKSEPGIAVQPDALDTHPWLLNCINGTLDLHTGTLRPHSQADLLTKCLPLAYDPDTRCEQWLAFLEKVMQGNAELITFLQRALGYSLTGSTREQCFFLLYGITKTGKSTFLNIAKALLGPYGTQADMSTFLHKDRETVRNDLADLAGMRLVCAIETDEGKRLAEALIKQLTGGTDTIKARFLFEEYFEYCPQFKVFLATNHKPTMNASDDALWERVKTIPFAVQIPQDRRDKQLEAKLRAELPGILAWAVCGCLAWQAADGLGEPAAVVQATKQYREEMDDVGRFLAEICIQGDAQPHKIQATALLQAYHRWIGNTTMTARALNTALTDRGYESKRFTTGMFWLGLGLPASEDPEQNK